MAVWFVMLHDMDETKRDHRSRPVAIELIFAAARLVAIGLLAVGISGIIALGPRCRGQAKPSLPATRQA
jgi:hypothetical protein